MVVCTHLFLDFTCPVLPQNLRMVWTGKNLRDHLAPKSIPWAEAPFPRLDAQSLIRPGLVCFYGWDIQKFSCPFPTSKHSVLEQFALHLRAWLCS